jgi:hypothetical protein
MAKGKNMAFWLKFLDYAGSVLDIPGKLVDKATGNDPASLEKARARCEAEKLKLAAELERVRSETTLRGEAARSAARIGEAKAAQEAAAEAERLQAELYEQELQFKLKCLKDVVGFISDVKVLHAEKVMTLSVEFERLYGDALIEAQNAQKSYQEERKKHMLEMIPLRETAPEVFGELVNGYRDIFTGHTEHVSILLHRMREDLPRLRDKVLDAVTEYRPENLLKEFGGSRALGGAPVGALPGGASAEKGAPLLPRKREKDFGE